MYRVHSPMIDAEEQGITKGLHVRCKMVMHCVSNRGEGTMVSLGIILIILHGGSVGVNKRGCDDGAREWVGLHARSGESNVSVGVGMWQSKAKLVAYTRVSVKEEGSLTWDSNKIIYKIIMLLLFIYWAEKAKKLCTKKRAANNGAVWGVASWIVINLFYFQGQGVGYITGYK